MDIKITKYDFGEDRCIWTIAFSKIITGAKLTLHLSVFCLSRSLTALERKGTVLKMQLFHVRATNTD